METPLELPTVNVRLQELSTNLSKLLSSLEGGLPLATAVFSYEAEFGPIIVESDAGVPFEHLISCIKGIRISKDVNGSKFITLNNSSSTPTQPTPLQDRIILLSNELRALIKFQPSFRMPLDRFSDRFTKHFGRQFRISDYGYTKLEDLLEAMPDVVHVIGEKAGAEITPSHCAQVERFGPHVRRALSKQPSKQASVTELPTLLARILDKPFNIYDYGVCDIRDMLPDIPSTLVEITTVEEDMVVSIPEKIPSPPSKLDETDTKQVEHDMEPKPSKQHRAQDKVEQIHQFAQECVLLLKHKTDFRLPIGLFVPSFLEYFGKELKMSDFGYKKLAQLIKAVPGVVEVTADSSGQYFIQLTDSARLSDKIRVSPKVQVEMTEEADRNGEQKKDLSQENLAQRREEFAQECTELLKEAPELKLPLNSFAVMYNRYFKRQCKVSDYGESKMINLFLSLPDTVRVTENSFGERFIHLKKVDKESLNIGERNVEIEPSEELSNTNEEGDMTVDADAKELDTDVKETNGITEEDILSGVKSLNLKKLLSCTACKCTARTPIRSCGDGHSISATRVRARTVRSEDASSP